MTAPPCRGGIADSADALRSETFHAAYHSTHDARGPHPQRLIDQVPQLDLTSGFEVRLAGMHGDPVGVLEPQLAQGASARCRPSVRAGGKSGQNGRGYSSAPTRRQRTRHTGTFVSSTRLNALTSCFARSRSPPICSSQTRMSAARACKLMKRSGSVCSTGDIAVGSGGG